MRTLRGWRIFWAGWSGCSRRSSLSGRSGRDSRHRMFPAQRVIARSARSREGRTVFRPQMHDLFRAALNIAFDQHQPRAHHLLAKAFHHLATPRYWRCRFSSSSVMKTTPLALPGRCRTSTTPAQRTYCRSWHGTRMRRPERVRCQILPAEIPSVALQRQSDGLIICDHMLRQRHQRQWCASFVRLPRARRRFRTAGAVYRRANAAPPKGRRDGRARWNETHRRPQQNQRPLGKRGVAGKILQRSKGAALACGDDALDPVCLHLSGLRGRSHRIARCDAGGGNSLHTSSVTRGGTPTPALPASGRGSAIPSRLTK